MTEPATRATSSHLVLTLCAAVVILTAASVQAQTYTILHNFTGSLDGAYPYAGLVLDRAGNLYGTASAGGSSSCPGGCGTVFRLSPHGSSWVFTPLYAFQGGMDGQAPLAPVVIAPDGTLYGTTTAGGMGSCNSNFGRGCGTVFRLRPPAHICNAVSCPWIEAVIYRFSGGLDGSAPGYGPLALDASSNLFGTTELGGQYGLGTAFELTAANGSWNEAVIHSFMGTTDGTIPQSSVVFDAAGNLFGTSDGSSGPGTGGVLFELSPSGPAWIFTVLHTFAVSEGDPLGELASTAPGVFYGVTYNFRGDPGLAYELSNSGQGWQYASIASLPPFGALTGPALDRAGNLYGVEPPQPHGLVYKLTESDGVWSYGVLHIFQDSGDNGAPNGVPLVDAQNNVYGTTIGGGSSDNGVIWKISQP
ncbi:MAG TPA: choice-of-anchor tandem repeat GloVer-containing protein [Candidatus Bathyarchaeia archaeon]|nr:choice-of-anchor tandem repeat GloVer-containing protein [Candidatus Bathyarchaeia archaeon]